MGARSSNDDLVIGVDGGGTKTIAWVAPFDDPTNQIILGRGQAGSGNPRAVGFEAAERAVMDAITQALTDAGRAREIVSAAWLGLAGAGRESEQTRLTEWAQNVAKIARRVRVSGDAELILAAGSAYHTGIALIAGTGSLAWGRNADGRIGRTGGCGYLLGDEGSAYAIAIAGLRTAMQSADGRQPPTRLLEKLLAHFQATSPANLIEILYTPDMTRDRIAGAAPLVFSLTEDPAAVSILSQAADDLAHMIVALAHQLGFAAGDYPLAMTGSLLLQQDQFRQAVADRLSAIAPRTVTLVSEPVRGAVLLARRFTASSSAAAACPG
jgi:N-acetylglucosamine kinase-like BadF-type ATPase